MTQQQKRILSVQDISCFGKCSNTVMLPMLSAAGLETVILPTALLSTHTGGFGGFTFLDLTDQMQKIIAHWEKIGLRFDALCTGYLGSPSQVDLLLTHIETLCLPSAARVIDPVLGDNGKLYTIYDDSFVQAMRRLCAYADILTPNLTEACLLTGIPYTGAHLTDAAMKALFDGLRALGARRIVLTGVMFSDTEIGIAAMDADGTVCTAGSRYIDAKLHGTGDVFTAALIGYLHRGCHFADAARNALTFVSAAIDATQPFLDTHWYGLCFEPCLWRLTDSGNAKTSPADSALSR